MKLKFSARVCLSLLFILAAAISSTGLVVWVLAGNQAMTRTEGILDQSLQNSEFDLRQEQNDLAALGTWLVNQNEFIAWVRASDSIALARMLEPLTVTGIVDVFAVTNSSGQVIVRVRENNPITQSDNIINQTGIKEALSGKSSNGLEPDEFGQLRGRYTLPIYDDISQPPVGVLVIGFYLDGPFFQRMARGLASEAIIVFNDRVAITNRAEGNGEAWIGQPVAEEIVRAEREGRPTGIVSLENPPNKYFFKFRPLHFPVSVPAGMYGVGILSEMVDSERIDLFREMTGWILLISGVIGTAAWLIARRLVAPILDLQTAAQNLANENLSEPIELRRTDELGEIAMQMEKIRVRWNELLEPKLPESRPISCGEIILDPRAHRVSVAGVPVRLSATEFKLAHYLITNRDTVVSASQIIANVWGYAADEDDDVVRMAISRLRKKIERDPSHPTALVTIPGAGYMLKSKS